MDFLVIFCFVLGFFGTQCTRCECIYLCILKIQFVVFIFILKKKTKQNAMYINLRNQIFIFIF